MNLNDPGKYEAAAKAARDATGGEVLLIVLNGKLGSGFEVAATLPTILAIPQMLRTVADNIELKLQKGSS